MKMALGKFSINKVFYEEYSTWASTRVLLCKYGKSMYTFLHISLGMKSIRVWHTQTQAKEININLSWNDIERWDGAL